MALGQQHFGGHAHQLAIGAQLLGIAGQAKHTDQPTVEQQRQVDPGLHALEALGCFHIQFDDTTIGQYQLRAFVAGVDALRLATAEDQALAVHDVDVARQNRHRPLDDVLCQVMVQFEHGRILVVAMIGPGHSRPGKMLCKSTKTATARSPRLAAAAASMQAAAINITTERESCHTALPLTKAKTPPAMRCIGALPCG
ncbi:hypothetical protein D9M71_569160 [compost metagenome]